nr:hypothetical protein [Tanacetum cinerariifolium]
EQNNEFNEQIKVLNEKNADLLDQTKVLKDQLQVKHVVIDTHVECHEKYAKLEEERYEYMIRYSALCDNDKQHRKKTDEQEILFDKMSRQLVEMNNNVLRLHEKILEKETKISELEGCVSNKDVEIENCLERLNECENKLHKIGQTNQTIHMIMPSKGTLYNGRKGIDLDTFSSVRRPKHSGVIWKKKWSSNTSNVDLSSEIINPDFEKIDSPFQQTSSLKPYVPNCVSPISMSKSSCDSKNVEIKLKRKRRKRKSSKQNGKQVDNDVPRANSDFVHFSDLDTFSSVRRPKNRGVMWKKKGLSNTFNVGLSAVSVSNLNKNVKRYSRKDLLACNNSHLGETRSISVCDDAMNVSCNSRLNDLLDDNNFFIFDDVNVRISPVSRRLLGKSLVILCMCVLRVT